jgi:hypothetical protein
LLVIFTANICPLICLCCLGVLQNINSVPGTIFVIISCLGGICMVWYLSIIGLVQAIMLYVSGFQFLGRIWGGLRPWHKTLLVLVPLDMVLWKLFFSRF